MASTVEPKRGGVLNVDLLATGDLGKVRENNGGGEGEY